MNRLSARRRGLRVAILTDEQGAHPASPASVPFLPDVSPREQQPGIAGLWRVRRRPVRPMAVRRTATVSPGAHAAGSG